MILNWALSGARSKDMEWLEHPDLEDADVARLWDFLEFTDKYLGGNGIVTSHLSRFSSRWNIEQPISILVLRCGRGALAHSLSRWGRRRGWDLQIHAVDRSEHLITMARERYRDDTSMTFEVRELKDSFFLQAQQFDYVVSSLALHHYSDEEASAFLKTMDRLAKRGIVLTDWLRDRRGSFWFQLLARVFRHPLVLDDAVTMIRRGFTPKEIKKLLREVGLEYATLAEHLGYRFSVAGERAYATSVESRPVTGLVGT